jgi:hypothetical protein
LYAIGALSRVATIGLFFDVFEITNLKGSSNFGKFRYDHLARVQHIFIRQADKGAV